MAQDGREGSEILNLSHSELQAAAGWAPVLGIPSVTLVSKSHAGNQNLTRAGRAGGGTWRCKVCGNQKEQEESGSSRAVWEALCSCWTG